MARHLNLLFQGGGVKGIAYAGVMAKMPADCEVEAVGGTSAGAIAAALVALGLRGKELKETLSDPALFRILNDTEVARLARLKAVAKQLKPLAEQLATSGKLKTGYALYQVLKQNPTLVSDAAAIWNAKGLHSTTGLRTWLDGVFGERRFSDVGIGDLRIVAADVTRRKYDVFTKARHPEKLIAEAVLGSASIPLFFEPFKTGGDYMVDGGMLSNFPSFLFAQAKYPTIGFRFREFTPPPKIAGTVDYLLALLLTMTDAHDKRTEVPNLTVYDIPIPPQITSTKFGLDPAEVQNLYSVGETVGTGVNWKAGSSEKVVTSYFDPKPHQALEQSLRAADELGLRYRNRKELWAHAVHFQSTFVVRIEPDWSTRYERENVVSVAGPKALFLSPFQVIWNTALGYARSLADTDVQYAEISPGGDAIELLRVPSSNAEASKGFVAFFIPPIAEGDPPRRFKASLDIPREFERSLGRGESDLVGCSTFQLARTHVLSLTYQILASKELPPLRFSPEFGFASERSLDNVAIGNRAYRGHEWILEELAVTGELSQIVNIGI